MEIALRTAADVLSEQSLSEIEYEAVRSVEGVNEAIVQIDETNLNVAVVHGGKEALMLVEQILSGDNNTTLQRS